MNEHNFDEEVVGVEGAEDFDDNFKLIMDELGFYQDHPKPRSLFGFIESKITPENLPDKWDIIAGLILAAAASATIIGISTASYYIVAGLSAQNIFSASAIAALAESDKMDAVTSKLSVFLAKEMEWVFEMDPFTEIKGIHTALKCFLVDQFGNEESLEQFLLNADNINTNTTNDLIQFDE